MTQREFEKSLEPGQDIRLRWRGLCGRATVLKVFRASILVETKEEIGGQPAGSRLRVNRVSAGRWSYSNSVRPLNESSRF